MFFYVTPIKPFFRPNLYMIQRIRFLTHAVELANLKERYVNKVTNMWQLWQDCHSKSVHYTQSQTKKNLLRALGQKQIKLSQHNYTNTFIKIWQDDSRKPSYGNRVHSLWQSWHDCHSKSVHPKTIKEEKRVGSVQTKQFIFHKIITPTHPSRYDKMIL